MKVPKITLTLLTSFSLLSAMEETSISEQEHFLMLDESYTNSEGCYGEERYVELPCEDALQTIPSKECGTWYFLADYLYWKPCPDGAFDYVKAERHGSENNVKVHSDTKSAIGEAETGFRLGVGYQFPCSDWDIGVRWLHFDPSDSRKASLSSGEKIIPFGGYFLLPELQILMVNDGLTKVEVISPMVAKGHWDLDLDVVDLEFGMHMLFGRCLFLRPHVDVRIATIDQELKIASQGSVSGVEIGGPFQAKSRFKNEFKGIGPRIGLDTRYELGCGWGLYADVAAACLFGHQDASFKENLTVDITMGGSQEFDLFTKSKSNRHCTRVITDAAFGIYWRTCFCCGLYNLSVKCGWEHHYFFSQGVADAFPGNQNFSHEDKDLPTQGLTISAVLAY